MKSSSSQYQRELLGFLESLREPVTRRLRQFVSLPIESEIAHVLFEDIGDTHGTRFPVLISLTTRENDVYCDSRRVMLSTLPFGIVSEMNPAASDCGVDDASEEWKAVFFP